MDLENAASGVVGEGEPLPGAILSREPNVVLQLMAREGVYDPALDYKEAYTLHFINNGYGRDYQRGLGE